MEDSAESAIEMHTNNDENINANNYKVVKPQVTERENRPEPETTADVRVNGNANLHVNNNKVVKMQGAEMKYRGEREVADNVHVNNDEKLAFNLKIVKVQGAVTENFADLEAASTIKKHFNNDTYFQTVDFKRVQLQEPFRPVHTDDNDNCNVIYVSSESEDDSDTEAARFDAYNYYRSKKKIFGTTSSQK